MATTAKTTRKQPKPYYALVRKIEVGPFVGTWGLQFGSKVRSDVVAELAEHRRLDKTYLAEPADPRPVYRILKCRTARKSDIDKAIALHERTMANIERLKALASAPRGWDCIEAGFEAL